MVRHRSRSEEGEGSEGFSLIELMVALSVFGLVLSMTLSAHFAAERTQEASFRVVNAHQNARVALDLLSRDLRMAGSGVGNVPIDLSFEGHAVTRYPITPLPSFAGRDSLEILGGQWPVSSVLKSAMVGGGDPIPVADATGFSSGDMVAISSLNRGYLLQVTGVDEEGRLEHDGSSPWNNLGDNWPQAGFAAGSRVTRVEYVRYFLDQSDPGHPVLMRWRANEESPAFVAKDVESLALAYIEGDTAVANPEDPLNIRGVRITATAVAGDARDPESARRPLSTTVVPRILN